MRCGCCICVLVGVGKSSITNALIPSLDLAVGRLTKGGLGAHVTSTATLHRVSWATGGGDGEDSDDNKDNDGVTGGWIVDSPGLREFGLAHISAGAVQKLFPEINSLGVNCKYKNCRHESGQKDCAVLAAVKAGSIAVSRWKSYVQIMSECASDVAGAVTKKKK